MQKKLWCLKVPKEKKKSYKKYNHKNLFSKIIKQTFQSAPQLLSFPGNRDCKCNTQLLLRIWKCFLHKISKHSRDDHFSFQKGESGNTDVTWHHITISHQNKHERATFPQTLSRHSLTPTSCIYLDQSARSRFPGVSLIIDWTEENHCTKLWCPITPDWFLSTTHCSLHCCIPLNPPSPDRTHLQNSGEHLLPAVRTFKLWKDASNLTLPSTCDLAVL